jgi:hypothetical protein
MDDSNRDPQSEVELTDGVDSSEVEVEPKKLLLGKRVIRAFGVRSGLRTGAWTDTNTSSDCGRSRD